jgi:hypothetical protein
MKREKESPDYCSQGGERGGEDTPTESDSSEEEEGGGITLPPLSPPRTTPMLFGDIADWGRHRQAPTEIK